MENLKAALLRLNCSAVVWSWAMNGLRLASGLVVLPLLVRNLSESDFGMYFVLLGLSALIPTLDFGFAVSIGRAVSYAMGGARTLKSLNLEPARENSGPNLALLRQLLITTQQLYRWITVLTLILLGSGGSIAVAFRIQETSSPHITWAAWGVTLLAAVLEIYAGWWNVFLRSMNQVLAGARQVALAQAMKIALSCALLLLGAGLLAVPVASLISSCLQRAMSRRLVIRLLGETGDRLPSGEVANLVKTLWPNTWRLGIYFLGGYLNGYAYSILCPILFGLAAGAQYSFTLQLLTIASSMAQVWTFVKWPVVGQLRIQANNPAIRQLLWPRLWLQLLTFALLALGLLLVGPTALLWLNTDKSLLSPVLFGLLGLYLFLEMHCTFWSTLISMANRLPMVWPTLLSNVISLAVILALLEVRGPSIQFFVIIPLLVGMAYNHWKWPAEGAASIGTTWWRFLTRRP